MGGYGCISWWLTTVNHNNRNKIMGFGILPLYSKEIYYRDNISVEIRLYSFRVFDVLLE